MLVTLWELSFLKEKPIYYVVFRLDLLESKYLHVHIVFVQGWKASRTQSILSTRMEVGFVHGGDPVRRHKAVPKPSRDVNTHQGWVANPTQRRSISTSSASSNPTTQGTALPHSQGGDMQFNFVYYDNFFFWKSYESLNEFGLVARTSRRWIHSYLI